MNYVEREIAALKQQLSALEKVAAGERAKYDALRRLPTKSVVRFDKRFGGGASKAYHYGAILVDGKWFLTGTGGGRDTDSLISFIADGGSNLEVARFTPMPDTRWASGGSVSVDFPWLQRTAGRTY